jgi:hypothetical protein
MWFLTQLAEKRIEEARDRGELDNLPGQGRPLPAEEINPLVPEHQRMAYRILKNSGYLPPELEMHREAVEIALRLAELGEGAAAAKMCDRLGKINLLLAESGFRRLCVPANYLTALSAKLAGQSQSDVLSLKTDGGQ